MTSLIQQALAPWHEFYALLGAASATLLGLQFVAASVGTGMFSRDRMAPLRVFLSATVVHFASILAICLIMLAPIRRSALVGLIVLGCGLFGVAYCAVAWRSSVREGLHTRIDREDRIWYVLLPVIGYLVESSAAITLAVWPDTGAVILALSVGLLLLSAIHNAWDITVWSVTRRRD